MSAERVREFYRKQGAERELQRIIEAINEYNKLYGIENYLFQELLLTISPIAVKTQLFPNKTKTDWEDDDQVVTTYGSIQLSLSQAHAAGIKTERARLIALFKEQHVIRNCAATNKVVFVDCNTLEVLYLKDDLMNMSAS
jgi:hypothetical protein